MAEPSRSTEGTGSEGTLYGFPRPYAPVVVHVYTFEYNILLKICGPNTRGTTLSLMSLF